MPSPLDKLAENALLRMKNLFEISKVVTKRKIRKIEIFDDYALRNKKSKFNEFYEALRDGKFKNDREAADLLYGCQPTDPKYRQLKSRFRKRLLNTLFFLDINLPKAANYDRAYYSCNKDWTLAQTLLWYDAPSSAAQIARQVFTTSLKYKFADFIVNSARLLRQQAAAEGDQKAYEAYDDQIKQFTPVLEAEIRSEELYQRVIIDYNKPFLEPQGLIERVDAYCNALLGLSERYKDSPVILYNTYLVWIYRYEMTQDFQMMLSVCEKGEQFVKENPVYKQHRKIGAFQTKKMAAYLHLRNFRDGRSNAEKCLRELEEGSDGWFTFMEFYFLLSMHTENYTHAIAILKETYSHSKRKKLKAEEAEKWEMFNGYVGYIIESEGKNNPVLHMQQLKHFNPKQIINDKAEYPKDQRIFAVHTLILQVLLLLERRQFNDARDRILILKKYASRQLRKETYFRTVNFIRLLQQYEKAGFQPEALSNTHKYLQALKDKPFFYRGTTIELEVMPYELLWQRIQKYSM
jgi:hypothetical protein